MAFGTNDPLSGYACGSQGIQGDSGGANQQPVALQFSRTLNGGRTWQTPYTLSFGKGFATCEVHIDPADAKDVLLGRIYGCDVGLCDGNSGLVFGWYRSRDGGQTWNQLAYPATLTSAVTPKGLFLFDHFSWEGTTLYAAVNVTCLGACLPGPPNPILVSKSGGAFVALPTAPLTAALQAPYTAFITPIFWVKGTMNVLFVYQSSGTWGKTGVLGGLTSHDSGQHWTTFTPTCNGGAAYYTLELKVITQTTILGICNDAHSITGAGVMVQSADGQTWTALPTQPPGDISVHSPLLITPDGTLYMGTTGTQGGIVQLPTGATAWQMVAPYAAQSYSNLAAVSWDVTGHTVALWGTVVTTKKISGGAFGTREIPTSFGLAYHAAAPGQ